MNRLLILIACVVVGCSTAPTTPAKWIQTELFFGLSKPDGSLVSDEQWRRFLDEHITPRFPDGLTVIEARGQYLDRQHVIEREPSKIVILFYPRERARAVDASVTQIVREYCTEFNQETVLRADSVQKASLLSRLPGVTARGGRGNRRTGCW